MTEKTTGIRVLFTGQHWPGANTLYIAKAFERCGAIVHFLNDTTLFPGWVGTPGGKIARRLLLRPVIEREWNKQLLNITEIFKPDLVYITDADFCWPGTLKAIKKRAIPIMCFYHDVHWKNRPGSRFTRNISYFDLVATTRKWQEQEFIAAGANAVSCVRFGYEPLVHRPMQVETLATERYGSDITFIGTFAAHRANELNALVTKDFMYKFHIWGGLWDRLPRGSILRKYWQGRMVHEQEIPVIYATSKVALHWVGWEPHGKDESMRKGDQHNSRTFQIAACGGAMMLAQRTEEHRGFFREDVEAVFFDDVKELREKLDFWLDPVRDENRINIASAARKRCLSEDYSYVPIVKRYLEYFRFPTIC